MTAPYAPRRITYDFLASQPFYDGRVLGRVLDALCAEPLLTPHKFGTDERRLDPFDLAKFPRTENEPSGINLYFARSKRIKYRPAVFTQNESPRLGVDFDPDMSERDYQTVFDTADDVAAACEPDIAIVHFSSHVTLPSASPGDETQKAMDLASDLHVVRWKAYGPRGLGMRTYLGPALIEQIGHVELRRLPLPVVELPWGGVRVDLTPQPWQSTREALLAAWQGAMAQLSRAGIFATYEVAANGAVRWLRGPNFKNVARPAP